MPKANYLAHQAEIDAAVARVMMSGRYILGEEVSTFEHEFARYIGVRFAVGVASGTDALHLALRAIGVGVGDVVYTVSNTANATVAAIELCGAEPSFVDVDARTFVMDPNSLEDAIKRTHRGRPRCVLPVHLYGLPAPMAELIAIAQRHDLIILEDAAQAHGASIAGVRVGSFGLLAAFSFYPTKNLGALGDGGMIVTDDAAIAERLRSLREYGWQRRYVSEEPGMNSRLDELQAAILRVKLQYLDAENQSRRAIAGIYSEGLAGSAFVLPVAAPDAYHVFHQYVIQCEHRDALQRYLLDCQIGTLVHYPVPIHQQPAYAGRKLNCVPLTYTERLGDNRILSLPIYPELSPDDVGHTAESMLQWLSRAP